MVDFSLQKGRGAGAWAERQVACLVVMLGPEPKARATQGLGSRTQVPGGTVQMCGTSWDCPDVV